MWTHIKPFKKLNTTRERIEHWGRQELSHALNQRRLVGFIGSGVTTAYGRLTWGEFCRLIVMAVDDLYRKKRVSGIPEFDLSNAEDLYKSLAYTCGQEIQSEEDVICPTIDKEFDVDTSLLELCVELTEALGEKDFIKRETKKIMTASPLLQFESRLILLDGSRDKHKNPDKSSDTCVPTVNDNASYLDKSLFRDWQNSLEKFLSQPKNKFGWKCSRTSDVENFKEYISIDEAVSWFFHMLDDMKLKESDTIKELLEDKLDKNCLSQIIDNIINDGYLNTTNIFIWEYLKESNEETRHKIYPIIFCLLIQKSESTVRWFVNNFIPEEELSKVKKLDDKWPHPIKHIVETLGIRRILTLNYDMEIEKYFENERGFKPESWFVTPDEDNCLIERNYSATDGYGDRFYSVTPNKINASDLIDFVALTSHHDAYVFHLHGRADCEQDLIITEYDYQKRYVHNSTTRQAFDEGMRTLFSGNDVLFLGIGMNEADLFRPMRQFMSNRKHFISEQEGIIALLGKKKFSDSETSSIDSLKELASCETKSTKFQIEYGVKTLYYDLKESQNKIEKDKISYVASSKEADVEACITTLLYELEADKDNSAKGPEKVDIEKRIKSLIYKLKSEKRENSEETVDIEFEERKKKFISAKTVSLSESLNINVEVHKKALLSWMYSDRKSTKQQSDAFVNALKNNAKMQQQWFKNWTKRPDGRYGLLRNYQGSVEPKWIRQRVIESIDNKKGSTSSKKHENIIYDRLKSEISNAYKMGKSSDIINNVTDRGCRIIRIMGAKGIGKGTLIGKLQKNYSEFIPDMAGNHLPNKYAGSFFVDTRYSTEFNSVISSLIRFLAGRLAQTTPGHSKKTFLAECGAFEPAIKQILLGNQFEEEGRLQILKRYIDRYKERQEFQDNNRLFICLSGLDRIVNQEGQGYNALHRAFFRILTGSGIIPDVSNTDNGEDYFANTPPFDIVLISEEMDVPIRYLSEYKFTEPGQTNAKKLVTTQNALLQRWYNIPSKIYQPEPSFGDSPFLNKLIQRNFFLRMIVTKCIEELTKPPENSNDLLSKLDFAAARNGIDEVLEVIFRSYYILDAKDNCQEFASLVALVLRRLVLFSMPIQRSVLADFPAIRNSIIKLNRRKGTVNDKPLTSRQMSKWLYKRILVPLFNRNLIIAVAHDGLGKSRHKAIFGKQTLTSNEGYYRFVLHSLIREHLAKRMRYVAFDHGEHSFFDVSSYATQPRDLPSPTSQDYREVGRVLHDMIDFSRDYLQVFYRLSKSNDDENRARVLTTLFNNDTLHVVSHKLRACLNLVSGSFSIGVISRLLDETRDKFDFGGEAVKPYDSYRGWIRGLLNAAVALDETDKVYLDFSNNNEDQIDELVDSKFSKHKDEFNEIRNFINDYRIQEPFYSTEIVWLYNERGLVSLVQGRLFDAITFFDSALEQIIDDNWVSPAKFESTAARSSFRKVTINKAIALLEAGEINEAYDVLLKLHNELERKQRQIPNFTLYLAKGYLGLCHHLAGRKNSARILYKEALDYFENKPNHMRTVAIFRRHLADLYRGMSDFDEARKLISQSISIASSAEQQDILHHAYVSKAHLIRWSGGKTSKAMDLLVKAEAYATKMGIPKLAVDCYTAKGEIMIAQQQLDRAGKYLTDSIAISNKYGMNLRKISALKSYANLLRKRGVDDQLLRRIQIVTKALSEKTGLLHVPEEPEAW